MNKVHLIGRLAAEPTTRDTASTKITELRIVTDRPRIRDGKVQKDPETGYTLKDAEFHKVTAFAGLGVPVREHKAKGDQLAITGRIHYTKWTDSDGNDRYGCEIVAEEIEFL